jgi:hypothetical protein
LESAGVEEVVVEPGEVDITAVDVSDTLVCTPDVDVVVIDTNGDLASALALTLSTSELSENSFKILKRNLKLASKYMRNHKEIELL